jgi:hypothetical protein
MTKDSAPNDRKHFLTTNCQIYTNKKCSIGMINLTRLKHWKIKEEIHIKFSRRNNWENCLSKCLQRHLKRWELRRTE